MAFPATPRALYTELWIGGNWIDISADVRAKDPVRWTSGKSDRSSTTSPSTANFTLNNGASLVPATIGQRACYSIRNPLGPYYGLLTRNNQIRQKLRGLAAPTFDASSSAAPGTGAGGFSWTHTGAATATGVLVWVLQSGSTTFQSLTVTYGGVNVPTRTGSVTATGRIYAFFLGEQVPAGPQTVTVLPAAPGPTLLPVAVTVTGGNATEINSILAATNTTANPSVSLATAPNCAVFGVLHSGQDAVTGVTPGAGYTDIIENDFGTDTGSIIRRTASSTTNPTTIAWTATADTWTAIGYTVNAVSYRFWGELSDLPNTWDTTANDADAQVQAGGILRRIQQGDRPVFSSLREYLAAFPARCYWPLDDGASSTSGVNLGSDPGNTGRWIVPTTASTFDGDLQPLSTGFKMVNADSSGAPMAFTNLNGAPNSQMAVDFVYRPDIAGTVTLSIDLTSGVRFNIIGRHDGVNNDWLLQLSLTNPTTGVETLTTYADTVRLRELVDYQLHHIRVTFVVSGANVAATLYLDGVSACTGTFPAVTLTALNWRRIFAFFIPQLDGAIFTIGHVALWDDFFPAPDLATTVEASQLWSGETAADRFERLCTTAEFPFVVQGNNADTIRMGQQGTDYFSSQLAEIEATDLGMLYEPRDQLAVGYRTRASLYNQDAAVTASFPAGELATGFSPVEDDADIRNDVYAQRRNGGSAQATLLTGPLSVTAPPNGAGRYKDEVPVNVQLDSDLPPIAGWLLALGTVDEPRFPQIRFDLALSGVVNNPALADGLLRIKEGDRLTLTGTGPKLGLYDGVSQIVLGRQETLDNAGYSHEVVFNCAPASVYEVAEFDDGVSRFDPGEYTVTNGAVTSTATTLPVLSDSVNGAFAYWSTNAAMMPISIMVQGEEMTVTAISAGVAGAQNFTVVRSVNGVVKAQGFGALVYLKRPTRIAL